MYTKIDNEQLEKLVYELIKRNISSRVVKTLCNVKSLTELNVVQYNYLLFLLNS